MTSNETGSDMGETAMNTKKELNALKEEVETLNRKLHELTDEELEQVSGGGYVKDIDSNGDPTHPNGTNLPELNGPVA